MPPIEHEQREPASEQVSARWALETLIYLGVVYLMLRPDALEQLEQRAAALASAARDRYQRAVGVWRTRREIGDLPETEGGATPGCDGNP